MGLLPEPELEIDEFKCQIFVKPMVGIKRVLVDAAITRLDANFEESLTEVLGVAA